MPTTTATLAIPKVLAGSDFVHTWDDTSAGVSDWLEAYLKPTTVTGSTAGANITLTELTVYRCGPTAVVSLNLTATAALAAGATLVTLGSRARPPVNLHVGPLALVTGSETPLRVTLTSGGVLATGVAVPLNGIIRGGFSVPVAGA